MSTKLFLNAAVACFLGITANSFAQSTPAAPQKEDVGRIGINSISPRATLDIEVKTTDETANQGIIIPNLSKVSIAKITEPVESTLVYISNVDNYTEGQNTTADALVANVNAKGFYFYDGTTWQPLQKTAPKLDYIISADGTVLMQWLNKYTQNIDMNQYSDMANVTTISERLLQNSGGVKTFIIKDGVTKIGNYAFQNTKDLKVTIPQSVTEIEEHAFEENKGVTELNLPNLKIAEDGIFQKSNLKSIDLSQLTTIKKNAFSYTKLLTTANFPSVTSVGKSAFEDSNLSNISLPEATLIGSWAFYNTHLTNISAPKVTTIGERAFGGSKITDINFPEVTSIGWGAFSGTKLTTLNLPKAQIIGGYAFESTNITSINLPEATSIGESAFSRTKLTTLNLPKVTTVNRYAFENSGLTSISLPNATSIGWGAFGDTKLTTLNLPKVTTVEERAFHGLTSLETLTLDSIITLTLEAIHVLPNLKKVILGETIKEIQDGNLRQLNKNAEVYIRATTPPSLTETFDINCTFYVPQASLNAYHTHQDWAPHKDKIKGYNY